MPSLSPLRANKRLRKAQPDSSSYQLRRNLLSTLCVYLPRSLSIIRFSQLRWVWAARVEIGFMLELCLQHLRVLARDDRLLIYNVLVLKAVKTRRADVANVTVKLSTRRCQIPLWLTDVAVPKAPLGVSVVGSPYCHAHMSEFVSWTHINRTKRVRVDPLIIARALYLSAKR
eukprot:SAG31_NODE_906_length_11091_cov_22.589065_4_plen_172_part_00